MSKSPLVMYVAMQQRPAAGMTRPTPKSRRRAPRRFALRLPHLPHLPRRKPAVESPATPVVFTPANLRP